MMNNIVYLESTKKEIVRPRNAFESFGRNAGGMGGMEFLHMYYQYTATPWKINVKMLIHINTNMIYNIVPSAVFVWSFRMSAMHFAVYAAKMTHIDNFSISILHQSHYGTP